MSLAEFDGWTPTTTTTHPDGSVTVSRTDTPWTAEQREIALAEYELVCPSCGNLREVCSDPDQTWWPHETHCYASAWRDVVVRRATKDETKPGDGLHRLDGLSLGVLPFDPDLGGDDD